MRGPMSTQFPHALTVCAEPTVSQSNPMWDIQLELSIRILGVSNLTVEVKALSTKLFINHLILFTSARRTSRGPN